MVSSTNKNNKRIAKNTAFLYFRMLLIMLVSLYTSRVVLSVLGVTDFGIYNVVGGVVTMLAFFNGSLSTATQRYLNYEMGKGDYKGLQKIFSMSFIGFCFIALLVIILAETVGLWFVYNKLVIPVDRMDAAVTIYHFSVMTFVISILKIPYNAAIIAHEKMSVYAYVSIVEACLKLLLVFLLQIIGYDKLIVYGFMMFVVAALIAFLYKGYCEKFFQECKLHWLWDKVLLKELFSFSGWMMWGTITNILSTQGINMLINMFFGPAMNTARAVAMQVNGAVSSFSSNFMTAVRPQIVKSYAEGDFSYMYKLVFSSSKLSFYLLFLLILPVLLNTEFILSIWLKEVPSYAALFTQLVLIDLLINSAYGPIADVAEASGKVRNYQLVISVGFLMIALLTWGAFKLQYPVELAFYIAILIDIVGLFMRLAVLSHIVNFPVGEYLKQVMMPVVLVFIALIGFLYVMKSLMMVEGVGDFIYESVLCVIVSFCGIYFIGLNKSEKKLLIDGLYKIVNRVR